MLSSLMSWPTNDLSNNVFILFCLVYSIIIGTCGGLIWQWANQPDRKRMGKYLGRIKALR